MYVFVTIASTGKNLEIEIVPVESKDYKKLTATRYFFKWKDQASNDVYKVLIKGQNDIIGVMSLNHLPDEYRIEIKLLASAKENMGKEKIYERIAGNLIAYACRLASKNYGANAAVTLFPKTKLIRHYTKCYGMEPVGTQLMLFGKSLFDILKKYNHG